MATETKREGNLEAPTRHPIDWKNPEYYDEEKLNAELERVFAHVLQRRQECEDADDPDVGLSVDVGGGRRVLYIGNGSWVQQRGEADVGRVGKHLQPMLHRGKSLGLTLITWHPCTQ